MRCLLVTIAAFLIACSCDPKSYPYEMGRFPEDPVNLTELNSAFDDMNSDYNPNGLVQEVEFIYTSNSKSKGGQFDFESRFLKFIWDKETGILIPKVLDSSTDGFHLFYNQVQELQSECNEKGPYSYYETGGKEGLKYMLFSRDCEGHYQMLGRRFIEAGETSQELQSEVTFRLFEEGTNEMYPSFMGENFSKEEAGPNSLVAESMVFSADKSGDFNLYQLKIPSDQNPLIFLSSDQAKDIQGIDELNSSANDHFPFVSDMLIVFASEREGGYGGYDLYYSIFEDNNWSKPQNFGAGINSEYDEFRPITVKKTQYGFENNLMIFSSNRPGGLGGFDLYFVGIPEF